MKKNFRIKRSKPKYDVAFFSCRSNDWQVSGIFDFVKDARKKQKELLEMMPPGTEIAICKRYTTWEKIASRSIKRLL